MQLHGPGSGDAATWLLGNGATHSCPGRRLGRLPDNPSPGQPLPVGSEGLPSLALVRGVPERPPLSPCRWRFLWNRAVSWVPRTWTQPWAQLCLWVLCAEAPFLPGGHRPSPGAWERQAGPRRPGYSGRRVGKHRGGRGVSSLWQNGGDRASAQKEQLNCIIILLFFPLL